MRLLFPRLICRGPLYTPVWASVHKEANIFYFRSRYRFAPEQRVVDMHWQRMLACMHKIRKYRQAILLRARMTNAV